MVLICGQVHTRKPLRALSAHWFSVLVLSVFTMGKEVEKAQPDVFWKLF